MPLISHYNIKNNSGPDVIARLASDLANPLVVPQFVFLILGYTNHLSLDKIGLLLGISTFFFTVIPIAIALVISYRQPARSLDFPDRTSRTALYGLSILSAFVGSMFITVLFNDSFIRLTALIFFINLLFGFVINFKWKVSVHSAALATGGLCLLFFSITSPTGQLSMVMGSFLLFMILPLVFWARYQLNIHSVPELFGGTVTGFLLTTLDIILWINAG